MTEKMQSIDIHNAEVYLCQTHTNQHFIYASNQLMVRICFWSLPFQKVAKNKNIRWLFCDRRRGS